MRKALVIAALLLAACEQPGAPGGAGAMRSNEACALTSNADDLFGAGADVAANSGLDGMAATCTWSSADGKRGGDLLLYTAQSLGNVTPEAQMDTLVQAWDATTETPLQAVDGLGDAAQIATDLPGYQVQIVFRKAGQVVAISARSGDPAVTDEALARRMAQAAAAAVNAP